jgi:nicotinamide mononucleotide transporter
MKNLIAKTFWTGYNTFEKFFLLFMVVRQIVVFCIMPDTPLNIIAGIAGVISVVLCAKGKVAFYFIGFVQTITYLFLAWQNCFYGEVLENIFYLVTMVWGIFVWKKNSVQNEDGTEDVVAKKFTTVQWIVSIIGTIIATVAMGYWLESIGSAQAYTDAATNVLAIFAQLLMVRRYREQWIWWLVIDLLCIKMWFVAGNWSMVAMYIAWTANCVYGWYNWSKLNKNQEVMTGEFSQ